MTGRATGRHRHLLRWLAVPVTAVAVLLALRLVILPELGSAEGAVTALQHVAPALVVLATALELASLAAYSALTAVVLGRPRPGFGTLLRIDLADLGLNHVVPGGGTTSGPVRIHMFERLRIPLDRGFSAATIEILGSNLVLGALFAGGLLLSLGSVQAASPYRTAIVAVLVLLAGCAVGVWLLLARTDGTASVVHRAAALVPRLDADAAAEVVRTMAASVRELSRDRRRLLRAVVLAALNWLLDAAALWVVFAAFGVVVPAGPLLAVYGLGSVLMMVPLTPGGLGLVEAVLVPAFTGFGVPAGTALLGVLGWRLLQFWMPLPLGLAAYGTLRLGAFRRAPSTGSKVTVPSSGHALGSRREDERIG